MGKTVASRPENKERTTLAPPVHSLAAHTGAGGEEQQTTDVGTKGKRQAEGLRMCTVFMPVILQLRHDGHISWRHTTYQNKKK